MKSIIFIGMIFLSVISVAAGAAIFRLRLMAPLDNNNPVPQLRGKTYLRLFLSEENDLTFNAVTQSLAAVGLLKPPSHWTGRLPLSARDHDIIAASYLQMMAADGEDYYQFNQYGLWLDSPIQTPDLRVPEESVIFRKQKHIIWDFIHTFVRANIVSVQVPEFTMTTAVLREQTLQKLVKADGAIKEIASRYPEQAEKYAADIIATLLSRVNPEDTPELAKRQDLFLQDLLKEVVSRRLLTHDQMHSTSLIDGYKAQIKSIENNKSIARSFVSLVGLLFIVDLISVINYDQTQLHTLAVSATTVFFFGPFVLVAVNRALRLIAKALQGPHNYIMVKTKLRPQISHPLAAACTKFLRSD